MATSAKAVFAELGEDDVSGFDTFIDSLDMLLGDSLCVDSLDGANNAQTTAYDRDVPKTRWEATPRVPAHCRDAIAKGIATVGKLGSVSGSLGGHEIALHTETDSLQRKQRASREAQRKFRYKQKVQSLLTSAPCLSFRLNVLPAQERKKATEAELNRTTALLADLRAQQALLRAKNRLLEQQQKTHKEPMVS